MGTGKVAVIDLHDMQTSSGSIIDPRHIYLAGFQTDGTSRLYISSVYLSMDGETDVTVDVSNNISVEKAVPVEYYTINGVKLNRPQPGINIVRMSDGRVKKYLLRR